MLQLKKYRTETVFKLCLRGLSSLTIPTSYHACIASLIDKIKYDSLLRLTVDF